MARLRTYNRRRLRKQRSADWRGWAKHGEPYGAVWLRARMKHGGGRVRKEWDDPFALEKKLELAEGYGSVKLAKKLRRRLAYLERLHLRPNVKVVGIILAPGSACIDIDQ